MPGNSSANIPPTETVGDSHLDVHSVRPRRNAGRLSGSGIDFTVENRIVNAFPREQKQGAAVIL